MLRLKSNSKLDASTHREKKYLLLQKTQGGVPYNLPETFCPRSKYVL
jgi:hypothetical protein